MGFPILVFAPQGTSLTAKAFEIADAAQTQYKVVLIRQTSASPSRRIPVIGDRYIKAKKVGERGLEDEEGFVLNELDNLPPGLVQDTSKEVEIGQALALEFQ